MRNEARLVLAALVWFSLEAVAADTVDSANSVVKLPMTVGAKMEMGQIVSGTSTAPSFSDPSGAYLSRTGIGLNQEVIVHQRLDMKIGVGGILFSTYPFQNPNSPNQGIKFGPTISQAQMTYSFGNLNKPSGVLRAGYFPYKYNPDAKNLGEYLFRSEAYPTFITTGGLSIVDNAQSKNLGFEFSFPAFNGRMKNDFLLTSETDFRPTGDFTPSYVTSVDAGPFQFGAGASFYHYLPIKPSYEDTKQASNQYFEFNAPSAFNVTNPNDTSEHIHIAAGQKIVANYNDASYIIAPALNPNWNIDSLNAAYHPSVHYYTFKAIKLMARASFNPQSLVRMDMLGPQDLKIYSEIALLGVQNYDGIYNDRMQRMPVMMGINLPAFKLLDVLSFEGEYFKSTNPDDIYEMQYADDPTYAANVAGGGTANGGQQNGYSILFRSFYPNGADNWKWSVYAAKQLMPGLSLRMQVANDHFRAIDGNITPANNFWTGAPLTRSSSDWYYVANLNFGI